MIDLETLETAVDRAAVRYDRDGDQHYDVISAFIKSLRGSDVDAALHYLARMLEAGEDARFIARRLVILASEDIGLADSTALTTAVAAAQAVQLVGLPEAQLNLAHAVIALALAPKSNAVITAIGEASADVRAGKIGRVPPHLRDAHYGGAKKLGHGTTYAYAHDDPRGVVPQQYAPDPVRDRTYYRPTRHGAEAAYAERLDKVRRILRAGSDADAAAVTAGRQRPGRAIRPAGRRRTAPVSTSTLHRPAVGGRGRRGRLRVDRGVPLAPLARRHALRGPAAPRRARAHARGGRAARLDHDRRGLRLHRAQRPDLPVAHGDCSGSSGSRSRRPR